MRQQAFIIVFALLSAISPGTLRGEIVNGSFEDLPAFAGWTDLSRGPLRLTSSPDFLGNEINAFAGTWFAEISVFINSPPLNPLPLENSSSFQQVFSASVGDELSLEHYAFGTATTLPAIAMSSAIVKLTNLSTDESVDLVHQSAGGAKAAYDTGPEWVSVSHTFTLAAEYRLTISVNVIASSPGFPPAPAGAIATLDIDNIRLISPALISDLTGDGFVDFDDLSVLLANWDADVSRNLGNFVDAEGTPIDFDDLAVLLSDWTGPGPGGSPMAGEQLAAAAVPEPSGVLLAVIGLLGLLGLVRRPSGVRRVAGG